MSGFTMFPEWLRAQKPEPAEVVAYLALAAFGTFNPSTGSYHECRPSIPTLAEETGLSENTLRKAIRSLLQRGALLAGGKRYDEKGGQLPTVYRVVFGVVTPPQNLNQGGADPEGGPVQADTPGGVPKSEGNQEPPTNNPTPKPSASPRGSRLPEGWMPGQHLVDWCAAELVPGGRWSEHTRDFVRRQTGKFADYWRAAPGQRGVKKDWDATWRNWMRTAFERDFRPANAPISGPPAGAFPTTAERNAAQRDRQMAQAKRAQDLMDQQGLDAREAYKRAGEEIAQNGMRTSTQTGYIDGVVIESGQKEVTGNAA
jgi:hypothetical protein